MVEPVKVILNVHSSGRFSADQKRAMVKAGLAAAGLDYDLSIVEAPGCGTTLAREAVASGYRSIVAAGGDGTINEVINGLLSATNDPDQCHLGIIPIGTANDLAFTLMLPTDISTACQHIASGNTRLIDVGKVNGHYFANNSAIGLEPIVTMIQHQMRWIKGVPRYVLAALQTVAGAKSWQMSLDWGTGSFEGRLLIVSVGNTRRTGGAFLMTPDAKPDDGQLDFVYAQDMNRLRMLWLLSKLFSGSHIYDPRIGYFRTKKLTITTSTPTPIQADGEVIEAAVTEISYQIIPARLRIYV